MDEVVAKKNFDKPLLPGFLLACVLAVFLGPLLARGADTSAPVHPVDGSCIREWLILGPIPSKDYEIDFLAEAGGEANVRPKEGDKVALKDGTVLAWTRVRSDRDYVNLEKVFGIHPWSISYAYCELYSDQAIETNLRGDFGEAARVWLNGQRAGEIPGTFERGSKDILEGVLVTLKAGRNPCLVKRREIAGFGQFSLQPLPASSPRVEFQVTDSDGRNIDNVPLQLYDNGQLRWRARTYTMRKVEACPYPGVEQYDVRVTFGETGAWLYQVPFRPNEPRTIKVKLTEAVSISGQVLAMNRSPQNAIVVEALRISTNETLASKSSSENVPTGIWSLPPYSAIAHSDTNGNFRFVNLRPGQYRLRCHGPGGYVYPEGVQKSEDAPLITVEAGRTHQGIRFVFPEAKKGVWRNYPVKKGLTDLNPRSIDRTPDGMLWVGTDQGTLHAYDGVEFETFSAPDIPGTHIYALNHDAQGTLWMGSSGGITRRVDGRFQTLLGSESLPRADVTAIHADPDGTIWFGTHSGLVRYRGGEFRTFTVRDGLPSNCVGSILRTKNGDLWVGTSTGLARFDGQGFSEPVPFPGRVSTQIRLISALHQARDGAIWFGLEDRDRGAYRYDGHALLRLGEEQGLLNDQIHDIAETSDGALWFATEKGLSRFDGTNILNYTQADGLGGSSVVDIFVDSDDVLWCATGSGVARFDPNGFNQFSERDGLRNGGGTPGVLDIKPDPNGDLWLATEWSEIYRMDGRNFKHFDPANDINLYVRQVHRTSDGTLWLATQAGIYKLEGTKLAKLLERNWVIALDSDDEGNLWYGHGWTGGGLSRYNLKTGETASFTKDHGLPNENVWSIASGEGGAVWVGTEAGLARYQHGKFERIQDGLGLPNGSVRRLRRDETGTVWISSSQGLYQWKSGSGISAVITNGLPDPEIWCSSQTRDGIIWMGTFNSGLLGYDGKAITVIDKRDGLSGNQPITLASRTPDSLWIGFFDKGLSCYRPTKSRPGVRLRSVRLDDRTLTNYSKLHDIETGHRVTIEYREIDLKTHPDKRQFWCRLSGPSGETMLQTVASDRHFEWTPEKGGVYHFEVQAIDRDLNYSAPARFSFRAVVPWYANAWVLAPGGAGVLGLLLFSSFTGWRYLVQRREAERLRERARIARNLHDHLGSGLTHLTLLGNFIRGQPDQPAATQTMAAQLSDSAQELSRTMSEVIWATDPIKDTLESFVSFVCTYAERFFAASSLRLRLDFPSEIPKVILPAEFRHSLFMVVKEALNNAAKYAEASELHIQMEIRDNMLCLSIRDNGRGFLRAQVGAERHGLGNMEARLRELGGQLRIESAPGQGTRIEARVPLPKK